MYEFLKFPHSHYSHTPRPISLSLRRVFCSVRVFWWIVYRGRRLVPDRQGTSGRSSEARGRSDMKMCCCTSCCCCCCCWFVVQQWGKVMQVWQQSVQLSAVCAPAGRVSNMRTVCTHTEITAQCVHILRTEHSVYTYWDHSTVCIHILRSQHSVHTLTKITAQCAHILRSQHSVHAHTKITVQCAQTY